MALFHRDCERDRTVRTPKGRARSGRCQSTSTPRPDLDEVMETETWLAPDLGPTQPVLDVARHGSGEDDAPSQRVATECIDCARGNSFSCEGDIPAVVGVHRERHSRCQFLRDASVPMTSRIMRKRGTRNKGRICPNK